MNQVRYWKHEFVEKHGSPTCRDNIVLVGNKCELIEERRVSYERGKALADECGWLFFETSAKENINVTEAFMAAARMAVSGGCTRAHARDATAPHPRARVSPCDADGFCTDCTESAKC